MALVQSGLTAFTSEILIVFVPAGLVRPLLRRVSKGRYELPDQIQLSRVAEFVEAERVGESTFETGGLPRDVFQNVAFRSAEYDALNQALNAGADIAGGVQEPMHFGRLGRYAEVHDWLRSVGGVRRPEEA